MTPLKIANDIAKISQLFRILMILTIFSRILRYLKWPTRSRDKSRLFIWEALHPLDSMAITLLKDYGSYLIISDDSTLTHLFDPALLEWYGYWHWNRNWANLSPCKLQSKRDIFYYIKSWLVLPDLYSRSVCPSLPDAWILCDKNLSQRRISIRFNLHTIPFGISNDE